MPNFRAKSEENIHAANLLIDKSLFTASVHCSYYAAFQMSKYILANFCDVGYKEQDNHSKGQGSHQYVSYRVRTCLNKLSSKYSDDYNTNYNKLKMLRKKADYTTIMIKKKEAENARNTAKRIIDLLTTNYK